MRQWEQLYVLAAGLNKQPFYKLIDIHAQK